MNEFVLHYIWQQKLFVCHDLKTTDGIPLTVIDVGKPNFNAGPDFFNAKIKIGNTLWAGNVEIHVKSSDWKKHKHQHDSGYQNVILHVVKICDVPVFLSDGELLPQLVLKYPASIEENYKQLLDSTQWIPCAGKLANFSAHEWTMWKTTLFVERLEQKVWEIRMQLEKNQFHWEKVFFQLLCKNLGFSINSEAFLNLAKSIPWLVVLKHQHDIFQLEALFFGQSGLLYNGDKTNVYVASLIREYSFIKQKFQLKGMDASQWKLLRLRPDNFPHIRIAQLTSLLHQHRNLFSKIIRVNTTEQIIQVFKQIEPTGYWKTHYRFEKESPATSKLMGVNSIHIIIINTILPLLCCYAVHKQDDAMMDKVFVMMDSLPAENNYIIRKWRAVGCDVKTATDSQAYIQLFTHYCEEKKCIRCRIGHNVLTKY